MARSFGSVEGTFIYRAIAHWLQEMVLYAKLQGNLQLSDNILVHIDLLSDIVKNCEGIDLVVSLPDFLDPSKLRIVRDTLKKNKKYELARDLSLKCGIEVDCVWAEWYPFTQRGLSNISGV